MHQVKNILVPVDFTSNTSLAVSKALDFCEAGKQACLHLFHVQQMTSGGIPGHLPAIVSGYTPHQINSDYRAPEQQLKELKTAILQKRQDIEIACSIWFGDTVQRNICEKAIKVSADLIIIGKQSNHSKLPFLNTVIPGKIAVATRIPVFTAKPGSYQQDIKTVVIPVGPLSPAVKIDLLTVFKTISFPQVKLVLFNESMTDLSRSKKLLTNALKLIKYRFVGNVSYEILQEKNRARALLAYCNKVGADVLIVYAGSETCIPGLANKNISDILPSRSKTQLLAITPV